MHTTVIRPTLIDGVDDDIIIRKMLLKMGY